MPLHALWASTEAIGSLSRPNDAPPAYIPMPNVETQIVDADGKMAARGAIGQLRIRGPHVALGYWDASRISAFPGGWYPTGGVMRQLENDRYQFVARHKDLIVRAGSNVSPMIEVERILLLHPCVIDATVLGVPDTKLGQRIVGFVHLTDDAGVALLDNILRFAFGRLADYKVPDQIYSLPLIPRNALGKIDRTALLKSI